MKIMKITKLVEYFSIKNMLLLEKLSVQSHMAYIIKKYQQKDHKIAI